MLIFQNQHKQIFKIEIITIILLVIIYFQKQFMKIQIQLAIFLKYIWLLLKINLKNI
ncbi:hypothetical protein pb186bvf_015100 [Paramecium bursaria]